MVTLSIIIYWQNPKGNPSIDIACLVSIGFFIYGPVMLIGVQALDLVPKNAVGTSAGLTGFFGYFLGTALLANIFSGYIIEKFAYDCFFICVIVGCFISILLMGVTLKNK